jgi:putative glutamine amidotransferase
MACDLRVVVDAFKKQPPPIRVEATNRAVYGGPADRTRPTTAAGDRQVRKRDARWRSWPDDATAENQPAGPDVSINGGDDTVEDHSPIRFRCDAPPFRIAGSAYFCPVLHTTPGSGPISLMMHGDRPVIGLTADADAEMLRLRRTYVEMIDASGGIPIILPCRPALAEAYIRLCDAIVLSGGDDPDMTAFGVAMHAKAKAIDPDRQAFELALLDALDGRPGLPVLGVCLGMQLMALHAGGTLDQYLPETLTTAADHWDHRAHAVSGELGAGEVWSHHRQAITHPGSLEVVARAHDGVIEAVRSPMSDGRRFYLGVQWHPERTEDPALGPGILRQLIEAARSATLERRSELPAAR